MPSETKPSRGHSKKPPRKKPDNHTKKHSQSSSHSQASSFPTSSLISSSTRSSPRRNAVANVEDIKNRAFRTEELTQRAHRFNYQLAIDLREILQAEFDSLEKYSADPKTSVLDLKVSLIALSNKIISEVDKQIDVQKKIAEAYEAMQLEVTNIAKKVLTELDTARLSVDETVAATRLLGDVMYVVKETVEYWVSRPGVSHKKLMDLKREVPRESMDLNEIWDKLESQMKMCHKALEHPLAGAVSVAKEFSKLNIYRRIATVI